MALRSTQPLTEMIVMNISFVDKDSQCVGLKNSTISCADCLELGASTSWGSRGVYLAWFVVNA